MDGREMPIGGYTYGNGRQSRGCLRSATASNKAGKRAVLHTVLHSCSLQLNYELLQNLRPIIQLHPIPLQKHPSQKSTSFASNNSPALFCCHPALRNQLSNPNPRALFSLNISENPANPPIDRPQVLFDHPFSVFSLTTAKFPPQARWCYVLDSLFSNRMIFGFSELS